SLRIGIYIEVSPHFSLDTLRPPHPEVRQLGSVGPAQALPMFPLQRVAARTSHGILSPPLPLMWMTLACTLAGRPCSRAAPAPARRAPWGSFRSAMSALETNNRTFFSQSSWLRPASIGSTDTATVTLSMAPLALARRCSARCSVRTYATLGPHAWRSTR